MEELPEELGQLQELKVLSLEKNSELSDEQLQALRNKLLHCKIDYDY